MEGWRLTSSLQAKRSLQNLANSRRAAHRGVKINVYEAYLPTLQACSQASSWLPRPHGNRRRSEGSRCSPQPRSQAPFGLIGEGQAKVDGKGVSGAEAMRSIGLQPFVLGPKEGLALLNGTQVSTSLALAGLFGAESVFAAALVAGCLSL